VGLAMLDAQPFGANDRFRFVDCRNGQHVGGHCLTSFAECSPPLGPPGQALMASFS
jgi:hypothetical protein